MMGHKRKQGDYNSLSMLKDPGIILSFAWLVFMTYRYAVSLPLLEQGEKLFYLLGEVQYFNNALGIGLSLIHICHGDRRRGNTGRRTVVFPEGKIFPVKQSSFGCLFSGAILVGNPLPTPSEPRLRRLLVRCAHSMASP